MSYADSLRQQATWIEESVAGQGDPNMRIELEDVDVDELRCAADHIQRLDRHEAAFHDMLTALEAVRDDMYHHTRESRPRTALIRQHALMKVMAAIDKAREAAP